MNIYNVIFNKIIPKYFRLFYKNSFISLGENSLIYEPRLSYNVNNIIMGNNSTVLQNSRIEFYNLSLNYKPKLYIGNYVRIHYNFTALIAADVRIEDDVLIASGVKIITENHGMNPLISESYISQPLISKEVIIKNGAWIGENVIILPGVIVGLKSIVGAGSVVTKSVPDYCIAAGNPAKIIKKFNHCTQQWEKAYDV